MFKGLKVNVLETHTKGLSKLCASEPKTKKKVVLS